MPRSSTTTPLALAWWLVLCLEPLRFLTFGVTLQGMKTKIAFAFVLAFCLAFLACSSNQIINSVEVAITAAEVALPIVAGASIPPATMTALLDYLQLASTALGKVSAIIEMGGSAASVAAQITAALSGIVQQDAQLQQQMAGLPSFIVSAINLVATDLASILDQYGQKYMSTAAPGAKAVASVKGEYHFEGSELERIENAKTRAAGLTKLVSAAKATRR
jgi:hypothetical protein